MSLEPFDPSTRVCLAVVALGTPQRLRDCLESLAGHASRHPFTIVCVINEAVGDETGLEFPMPAGVEAVRPGLNLGWPGGLHLARQSTRAEYLVWVQEDMSVLPGWLDALVDAADAHPEFAALGSFAVDERGEPTGVSAGDATPPHDVGRWNDTDSTARRRPVEVERADWVTSKGMLARTSAWDEVGGPDPALYPLNHVDKDFSTHLRAHGLAVALVPGARLTHLQSQSAPSMFRRFVSEYRDPQFNATWGPVAEQLGAGEATVEHSCKPWFPGDSQRADPVGAVTRIAARESSTMLIAFAKWANRFTTASVQHQADVDRHEASVARAGADTTIAALERELALQSSAAHAAARARDQSVTSGVEVETARRELAAAYESTLSWRLTAPLRAVRRLFSR